MSEVTIEVMMGENLDEILQEQYGSVIQSYNCDTGGGCDYCTCYVLEVRASHN